MTWHLDVTQLSAYAANTLTPGQEPAVESHLTRCATCQQTVATLFPVPVDVWAGVQEQITRPRLNPALRVLAAVGVPEDQLVLLASADDFRLPWAVAIGEAFVSVIAAVSLGRYDATDCLAELTAPTPYSKLRLALLRTLATLAVAFPTGLVISSAVPPLRDLVWAWLLPGLALIACAVWFLPSHPFARIR